MTQSQSESALTKNTLADHSLSEKALSGHASSGNSKIVTSNQDGIHRNLEKTVLKHIQSNYLKPYRQHNLDAFNQLLKLRDADPEKSMILDSCCGTGLSTELIAKQNPDCLVIGVDQSFKRLNKEREGEVWPDNCLLLQANCEDIWRLCIDNDIHFNKHYILYPNPWPKSVHLKRRWHGHPTFPFLKDLAEQTLLRSNWQLYLEEFAQGWFLLTHKQFSVESFEVTSPLTLFEKKYWHSGQPLYELKVAV